MIRTETAPVYGECSVQRKASSRQPTKLSENDTQIS